MNKLIKISSNENDEQEATEYLDMWQPSFNTTLEIRGLNSQTSFDFEA